MGVKSTEEMRLKLENRELEEQIGRKLQEKKKQQAADAKEDAMRRNMKSKHHSVNSSKQEDKEFAQPFPIDADVFRGSSIYTKYCGSCHTLQANSSSNQMWGPAIGNIYGRVSGADQNYTYSKKLSNSLFRWNRVNLFEFVKTMRVWGNQ